METLHNNETNTAQTEPKFKSKLENSTAELFQIESDLNKLCLDLGPLDSSFRELSDSIGNLSDFLRESIERNSEHLFKSKEDAENMKDIIDAASEVLQIGIKGYGSIKKERVRNKQLEVLLKNKIKIANAKLDTTKKLLVLSERNTQNFESLFNKYLLDQTYNLNDLQEKGILQSQIRQMQTSLSSFRLSYCCTETLKYIIAQFEAWQLEIQQDTSHPKPNEYWFNDYILNYRLFPKKELERVSPQLQISLERAQHEYKLSAPTLFVLIDSQLYATYLNLRSDTFSSTENIKYHYYERIASANNIVSKILSENEAFKRAQETFFLHQIKKKKGLNKYPLIHLKYILYIFIGNILCINYIDTNWLEILLSVLITTFFIYRWYKSYTKHKLVFHMALFNILSIGESDMYEIAGYVEEDIPDLEPNYEAQSKAILGAIIGGILGLLFIPIFGGVLIGAIIGALLFPGINLEDLEEDIEQF